MTMTNRFSIAQKVKQTKALQYLAICLCLMANTLIPSALATTNGGERLAPALEQQAKIQQKSDSAETLYSITEDVLQEDGQWVRRYYVSIRVNDLSAARDYGRIAIHYNHHYTDTALEFANTRAKDGRVIALSKDAIQHRVTGGGQDFYSDSSEIVFSLPDVSPGTILEFQYIKKSKVLPFPKLHAMIAVPHWFQNTVANDSWRADFVHNYRFSFTHPQSMPYHSKAFAGHTTKAKKSRSGTTETISWQMKNIAEVISERWFPRKEKMYPQIEISTLNDWSEMDQWTWEKVNDKLAVDDAVKTVLASLKLSADATKEEKIRAVYGYLQTQIRYVFAHLGRGGYEPHFPREVIQNRYGDCKDQTVLAVTLLRALGVESYPVLVETTRAGFDDTSLVKLIFDHMLVYIPAQTGHAELWMDTTGDRSLYPGMSTYLSGQNALVVNGAGGKLTHVPDLTEANHASMSLNYTQQPDDTTKVHLTLKLSGSFEQDIRSWWISDSNREHSLDQYLRGLFNNTLEFDVKGEVKNSEDIFTPVEVVGEFNFAKESGEEPPAQSASIRQMLSLLADTSGLPLPQSRVHAFVDPWPFSLSMRTEFSAKTDTPPALIQSSGDMQTPFFTLEQTGKNEGELLVYSANFKRNALNLSPSRYSDYYEKTQELNKLSPWVASLTQSNSDAVKQKVDAAKETHGENSAEANIAKAKQSIEAGNFTEALQFAEDAVTLAPDNAEAWYILATARGLNTLLDESAEAFEKADALGYKP